MATRSSSAPLAILGGPPAFAEPLLVGRPLIRRRRAWFSRLGDALDRRWLSNNGPFVRQFEQAVARRLAVRHVVATANGTLGLQLALRALNLHGEVIVPSFTYVATAHAAAWEGLTPVFCDVDLQTHNLDPGAVERLITRRTSAILGVHLWGRPAPVGRLARIAKRHGVRLLYDAAHAFGCSARGRMIGNFGDAEVFSFHATKSVTTIEGGAVATNNGALADRLRRLRRFGLSPDGEVETLGTNATMSEVNAALGLTTLEAFDEIVAHNRRCYTRYVEGLSGLPGIEVLPYDAREQTTYPFVVLDVGADAPFSRDEVAALLEAEGVHARRYFAPGCHRLPPYRRADARPRLPNTERLCRSLLTLPSGQAVTDRQVRTLTAVLRRAWADAPAVRQALAGRRQSTNGRARRERTA